MIDEYENLKSEFYELFKKYINANDFNSELDLEIKRKIYDLLKCYDSCCLKYEKNLNDRFYDLITLLKKESCEHDVSFEKTFKNCCYSDDFNSLLNKFYNYCIEVKRISDLTATDYQKKIRTFISSPQYLKKMIYSGVLGEVNSMDNLEKILFDNLEIIIARFYVKNFDEGNSINKHKNNLRSALRALNDFKQYIGGRNLTDDNDYNVSNRTKYLFNDKEYGKGRLVLAVIKDYFSKNPESTIENLINVFPDDLLGKYHIYGIIKLKSDIDPKNIGLEGGSKRYFSNQEDEIILKSGQIALVCNQWMNENFNAFLEYVKDKLLSLIHI